MAEIRYTRSGVRRPTVEAPNTPQARDACVVAKLENRAACAGLTCIELNDASRLKRVLFE